MNYKEFFIGFLIGFFIFISYINHTISLSYIILTLLLFYIVRTLFQHKEIFQSIAYLKTILITLACFALWLLLQPLILNLKYIDAFKEIKSQFLIPLLFFFIGIFLTTFQHKKITARTLINIIFFSGFLHLLIVVFMSIVLFLKTGTLPIRKVYLVPVDEINYLSGIIYSMFLAEVYNRIVNKNKPFLYLNQYLLPIIFLVFVFSIYIQGMRWGVVTFSGTSTLFLIIVLFNINMSLIKKLTIFLLFLGILSTMVYENFKHDKRWGDLIETVSIVLQDNSLYWVNKHKYPCPKLSNGECVNLSNYVRLAQQINGYKLLLDFPNGVGYSRYAYKNAIQHKYDAGENSFNFPHSSIVNLCIGVGFIGIMLYLIFLFFIIKFLVVQKNSYSKFFTLFFLFTFHTRSLVDSVMMNHNLKIFFLLLGIGLVSSISHNKEKNI